MRSVLIGFQLLFCTYPLLGFFLSNDGDTLQTIHLNNVVIISAQRSATNIFDRPESLGFLDKTQLKRIAPMSAPHALSYVPAVWMQRTNHGAGSPFIRGLTGYQTLLLVDDIRMNNSTYRSGPNQYLNTIDPATISEVEVLRGGGSVQYGSDAIGGTIHILSNDPEFSDDGMDISGGFSGKYWSNDMEWSGRGHIKVATENFALLGGFTYRKLGDIVAGGDLGEQSPSAYNEYGLDLKFIYKVGANHTFTGAYQQVMQNDVPLYYRIASGEYEWYQFDPQRRNLAYARLTSDYRNKWLSEIRYTVSIQNSLEVREKKKTGSEMLVQETDDVNTFGSSVDVISLITKKWHATSGVEYYRDFVGSSTISTNQDTGEQIRLRGLYPDGSKYDNFAIYSLHQYESEKLILTAGLRYNIISMQIPDELFGEVNIAPDALVGNAGIVFKLNHQHHLTATINNAFRAPNINDVSSFGIADFRYEVPAYDLKPETSLNKEIGYKLKNDWLSGAIHLFHQNLYDLIANVPVQYQGADSLDGHKIYQRKNVKEAIIYGGEIETEANFGRRLTSFASLSYTYGQNTSDDEPLRRIPPVFGRFGLRNEFGSGVSIRAEGVFAGKQDRLAQGDISDSRIAEGGTPGWFVSNIYGGYQWRQLDIQISIQNIFNEAYRIHGSGIDSIGRSLWLSLGASF